MGGRHKRVAPIVAELRRGMCYTQDQRITGAAGVFVRFCLAAGCPSSIIRQGAGVSVQHLLHPQGKRVGLGLPVEDVQRLAAWTDWVLAAYAWSQGLGSAESAAHAGLVARLAGCDLGAWDVGGMRHG